LTLRPSGFIALPGGERTGFDHADTYLDRGGSRLYVAHTAMNGVDVLDCRSNSYLRSLPDLPGVAGVLIDSQRDLLFTSDRGAARVSVFRCSDETLLARVDVGPRPNGLAFDTRRGRRSPADSDSGMVAVANVRTGATRLIARGAILYARNGLHHLRRGRR